MYFQGEESFIGDELVYGGCKGEQKNSVDYRECRYFKTEDACCRYYFITICYGPYVEEVLQELSQEPTDIIVMNSCLWDVHRHGKAGVEKYEENLEKLVSALQRLIPDCLFIWITTPPVHIKSKGGFLMQPGTDLVKINEVRYCNEIAREVFREANEMDSRFRIVDLDYVFRHFEHHRASDGVHWNARAHRRMSNMILEEVSKAFSKEVPRVLGGWDMQPYSTPYEPWDSHLANGWGSAPFEYDVTHPSNWDFMSGLDFPPGTHMSPPEVYPPYGPPHPMHPPPFGTPPYIDDPNGLMRNLQFYDLDDLGHARQQVEYQSENRKRQRQEDSDVETVPEKQYRFGFSNSHLPGKCKANQSDELSPKFRIIEDKGKMMKLVQIDNDTVIHVVFTDKEKEEYLKDQAKKQEQERLAKEKKEQEEIELMKGEYKGVGFNIEETVAYLSKNFVHSFGTEAKKSKSDFDEGFLESYFKASQRGDNIVPPLTVLAAQTLIKSCSCQYERTFIDHASENRYNVQAELNFNGPEYSSILSAGNQTPSTLLSDLPRIKIDTKSLLAMPSPFAKLKLGNNSIDKKDVNSNDELSLVSKYDVNEESEVLTENERSSEECKITENCNNIFVTSETNLVTSSYTNSGITNLENLPSINGECSPKCHTSSNESSTPNRADASLVLSSETSSKLSASASLPIVNDEAVLRLNSSLAVDSSRTKKRKERNPNETKEERRLRKKLRREKKEEKRRLKEQIKLLQPMSQVTTVVQSETTWDLPLGQDVNSRQRSATWGPNYMSSYSQSVSLPYNHQPSNNQPIYYQQQHVQQQHINIDQQLLIKQQLDQQQRLAIAQRQAQQQALLLQQRQQQEAAYQKSLGNNIPQPSVPQPQLYIDEYGQTYTLEEETFIMGPSGQIQSLNSSYVQQQMQGAQPPYINPSLLYLQQPSKFYN